MSASILWAGVVFLLGMGLIVLEVFIPSGGLLGFLAAVSVLGSIILAFQGSPLAGMVFLLASLVGVPVMVVLTLRWWPYTPIGRRMLLQVPQGDDVLPDNEEFRELRELIGKTGVAKTVMLPSGAAVVEGQTVNALSTGVVIEEGQAVRVVEVRGNRVVVRPVENYDGQPASDVAEETGPVTDELSRPIESLGIEPIDDPLA